jgi:hypothetical protein
LGLAGTARVRLYLFESAGYSVVPAIGSRREHVAMWSRLRLVVIAAGLIFLANIIVRLLGVTVFHKSDNAQINSGLAFLIAIGVIMIVSAYWWSVRYPLSRAVPELGLIMLSACLACVLIGPPLGWLFGKISGSQVEANPFAGGAGLFFSEIWHFLGVGIFGVILGLLASMAIGQDYRAKALKHFAETVTSKPHRSVRR